jgi:hypothetical protein
MSASNYFSPISLDEPCVCCHELFLPQNLRQLPCSCSYCVPCIEGMVRTRLEDKGFRLPQCCGSICDWEDDLKWVVSPQLAAAFDKKKEEFENTIPVYCADKTCPGSAALIPAEHQSAADETATCPVCGKKVCTKCKQASHPGRECVADAAEEEILALGKGKAWQRCPRCGELVERKNGCAHIK